MAISAQGLQAEITNISVRMGPPADNQYQYTASVIRTLSQFSALNTQWNDLLVACGDTNLCLRHEWLQLWLETFPPQELLTVLVRDEIGQLVAVAPFLISRNPSGLWSRCLRRLQFIGTSPEVYDSMKIVIHPEADAELAFGLIGDQVLLNRAHWDMVDLRYMDRQSHMMALHNRIQPFVKQVEFSQPMSIPYIELPEEWGEYASTLRKRKYQSDLNRIHNHIRNDFNASATDLIIHQPGADADERLARFLNFHKAYWQERGCRTEYSRHRKLLDFYLTVYQKFSELGAIGKSQPAFEFSTLELGGKPISYHFDIQAKPGCMGYLSCYEQSAKKYRPGVLHIEALIERTHRLGGRRFEFGRGDEHYKNQWHIQKRPLWNLLAFRTPLAHTFWQLDARLKETLNMARRNGNTQDGIVDHSSSTPAQPHVGG